MFCTGFWPQRRRCLKGRKPARQSGRRWLRPPLSSDSGINGPVVFICLHYSVNGCYSREPSFDFSQALQARLLSATFSGQQIRGHRELPRREKWARAFSHLFQEGLALGPAGRVALEPGLRDSPPGGRSPWGRRGPSRHSTEMATLAPLPTVWCREGSGPEGSLFSQDRPQGHHFIPRSLPHSVSNPASVARDHGAVTTRWERPGIHPTAAKSFQVSLRGTGKPRSRACVVTWPWKTAQGPAW